MYDKLLNPYDDRLKNNTFIFNAKPIKYAKFTLELKANNPIFDGYAKVLNENLQLKELYNYHSYLANEIYQKAILLDNSYISLLRKDFFLKFPQYTDEDFRRFILGNYGDDSDYLQRTLSKATHDCAVQFGLLQQI